MLDLMDLSVDCSIAMCSKIEGRRNGISGTTLYDGGENSFDDRSDIKC